MLASFLFHWLFDFGLKVGVIFCDKMSKSMDKMFSNLSIIYREKLIQTCSLFPAGHVIFSKIFIVVFNRFNQKLCISSLATQSLISKIL